MLVKVLLEFWTHVFDFILGSKVEHILPEFLGVRGLVLLINDVWHALSLQKPPKRIFLWLSGVSVDPSKQKILKESILVAHF